MKNNRPNNEEKIDTLLDSYDKQLEDIKPEKEYIAYKQISECTTNECLECCCCLYCCG